MRVYFLLDQMFERRQELDGLFQWIFYLHTHTLETAAAVTRFHLARAPLSHLDQFFRNELLFGASDLLVVVLLFLLLVLQLLLLLCVLLLLLQLGLLLRSPLLVPQLLQLLVGEVGWWAERRRECRPLARSRPLRAASPVSACSSLLSSIRGLSWRLRYIWMAVTAAL